MWPTLKKDLKAQTKSKLNFVDEASVASQTFNHKHPNDMHIRN